VLILDCPGTELPALQLHGAHAERALARLLDRAIAPVFVIDGTVWDDLECDGPDAGRARIHQRGGAHVAASDLGLDDAGLITLFEIQDAALAGQSVRVSRVIPSDQAGLAA
jgi:hypothetical protein